MKSLSGNILLVFSTVLLKSSQKQVLIFLLATIICTGRCYSQDRDAKILTVPEIEEGVPEPGKRVKVYLDNYPGINYTLFLPYNFTNVGKWGVICEVSYSGFEASTLGYGMSRGLDYLLISLPILNTNGDDLLDYYYPDDPLPTADCWLAILNDLNKKFVVDNDKIILSGFSRGSICVNYIGNCNDTISSKWAAYFGYAHFDGCCQIIPWGIHEERINRISGKKFLIAVGENDIAENCSKNAYNQLKDKGFPVTYIEHPDVHTDKWKNEAHNPFWILEDSEVAEEARNWLRNLFTED